VRKIFSSSSSSSSCDLSNLHRNHVVQIKQTNKHTCGGRSITKWSSWICSKSLDCWNLTSQLQLYQKISSLAYRSKSQNLHEFLQNCTTFFFSKRKKKKEKKPFPSYNSWLTKAFFFFFSTQFCDVAQVVIIQKDNLASFGYNKGCVTLWRYHLH